jgi:SAM-dependent methyltransferase
VELKDFIEWDISNWGRALDFWEDNTSLELERANALEVGGRHGGLSLWLAKKDVNVMCSDLEGPSEKAKEKHKNCDTTYPIQHNIISALDIPFQTHFDIILFKSVLASVGRNNHKDDQIKAIKQMHKALKYGGELWFAENLVASPVHQFMRKYFVPWGKICRYVSIVEILSFLNIFSDVKYTTAGFLGSFGRNEFQRAVLGNIDKVIVEKLVPKHGNI